VHVFDLENRDPIDLCFAVTAGPQLGQGQSGTVAWKFTGESGDRLN